ncbi:nucleobase:cation symporter-2 family protein [Streptomyces gobiensis]|uniref:nucleobase:cation symporter-2 family protein n=1 Tax=Streptomyces gobiensis TaxID=2875706 RepID=UPI001E574CFD|nr:nucleobase:cation symporter-2 family protein [Streptomyces gobiensis]UGY95274.1 purine permease [Streptomyces gobiensis]
MITSGLQHVAAMYAGVVAVPLVIGAAANLSPADTTLLMGASLFTAGIATLLQTLGIWKIGARLPFVNGVSFVGVAAMIAIIAAEGGGTGLPVIFGAVIVAGLFGFLISPWFCKLVRFFPPVVTGSVITLIGISLLPVAFGWVSDGGGSGEGAPARNIALAGITLVVTLVLNRFTRGFVRSIAILLGLTAGTLAAIPFGMTDFARLGDAELFAFPAPFHFGAPVFSIAPVISMCIVMLVIMTESTADMIALGKVVDKPVDEKTLAAGLRADTLGSAIAPVFNGFAATAFSQNVGLVAISKVRSRFVVAVGGGILILLGLSPIAAALVAAVPLPVLGGVGIVLFGTIAVSGIQTLVQSDLSKTGNALIVAVTLGVGLAPEMAHGFYGQFPDSVTIILDSGVSTGCFLAVLLNLVFNHLGQRRDGGTRVPRQRTGKSTIVDPH